MTALAESRTEFLKDGSAQIKVIVDTLKVFNGALMQEVISSGEVQPLATATGDLHRFAGVALDEVDNVDDGLSVKVHIGEGVVRCFGTGFAQTDVGQNAYGTDDQTITTTAGANTQLVGKVVEFISSTEVRVKLAPQAHAAPTTEFTVTNHTADVSYDADTAAVAELSDVLGSLILALDRAGIINATVS